MGCPNETCEMHKKARHNFMMQYILFVDQTLMESFSNQQQLTNNLLDKFKTGISLSNVTLGVRLNG